MGKIMLGFSMAKKNKTMTRDAKSGQFTIGLEASSYISRIEGLYLTKKMRAMFSSFEKQGLSPAARRKIIMDLYAKKAG